jgi:uncharacterized membrane protein (UPF0136 family)
MTRASLAVAGFVDPSLMIRSCGRGQRPRLQQCWTEASTWLTNAGASQMEAAKIYFIVFGLLTIAGGIIGYVKAGSVASIIAGSITGVLLLVAAFLLPEHRAAGLATALIVSLLLAAQFVPKFIRTSRVMPAGMMSILSVIGIIVAIVVWVRK